jgi:hypothetical protein
MIILNDILIDEDLFLQKFVCDLKTCKGECCVEGDSGAPLLEKELYKLEEFYPQAKEYLSEENQKAIKKQGFGVIDSDGDLGTPLVNNAECAFATHKDGIVMCAYERAFLEGKTTWRKPVSCYLYPIRMSKAGPFRVMKFHRWSICECAMKYGTELGVPAYKFLKEPIISEFGEDFYNQLCEVAEAYLKSKK